MDSLCGLLPSALFKNKKKTTGWCFGQWMFYLTHNSRTSRLDCCNAIHMGLPLEKPWNFHLAQNAIAHEVHSQPTSSDSSLLGDSFNFDNNQCLFLQWPFLWNNLLENMRGTHALIRFHKLWKVSPISTNYEWTVPVLLGMKSFTFQLITFAFSLLFCGIHSVLNLMISYISGRY